MKLHQKSVEFQEKATYLGGVSNILMFTPDDPILPIFSGFKPPTSNYSCYYIHLHVYDYVYTISEGGMIQVQFITFFFMDPRMNAKSWGPLWHIHPEESETPIFEDFLSKPVMVLGINIYQTSLGFLVFLVEDFFFSERAKSWKQKKFDGPPFSK